MQLAHTWQRFRSLSQPRVLCDAWPKVLPQPGGSLDATDTAIQCVPQPSSAHTWLTALVAFDELQSYRDVDTLLRRAVELLRQAVGLERAAIFLLRNGQLHGTFGTGLSGQTTDERHIAFALGKSHREAFTLAIRGLAQWSRFPNVPLFAQECNRTVVVRTGENVIVPITTAGRCIGLIACDKGFSGSNLDTESLIQAAVFARILGPCLGLGLSSTGPTFVGGLPAPVQGSPDPAYDRAGNDATSPNPQSELVGAALARLRLNPNEPRETLAKTLGTTADRLGRVFKAEMGVSLPNYRNKLRLQRFFSLVDPNGGDLLACALAAGFGSYAQFNRVFHQCYGTAPIAYLKQHAPSTSER